MKKILVFIDKDPAQYILQLNELHDIPVGGRAGTRNGVVRTDGIGSTDIWMKAIYHPNKELNKWYLREEIDTPENIIDDADYELTTQQEMVDDGWINGEIA